MEPIVVKITGDSTGLISATQAATGQGGLGGLAGSIAGLAGPIGIAVGAAAGVAVVLGDLTLAAAADKAEQEKLKTAIENSGAATGDWSAAVDTAITKGQDLAFTDTEIRDALLPLVQTTGDVDEATGLLEAAQDIARQTGTDLATAADAVAKAHDGEEGALKRLMPSLAGAEEGTDLVAEAAKLAKGAAEDFGESAEGQSKKAGDSFGELGEEVGAALLPILEELLPALQPFVELLGELIKEVIPILKPAIRGIVDVMRLVIDIFKDTVTAIKDIIEWVNSLWQKIQDAIGQIKNLTSFVPDIDWEGIAGRSGDPHVPPGTTSPFTTVNIYTGADPRSVVRHVRTYLETNGPDSLA